MVRVVPQIRIGKSKEANEIRSEGKRARSQNNALAIYAIFRKKRDILELGREGGKIRGDPKTAVVKGKGKGKKESSQPPLSNL